MSVKLDTRTFFFNAKTDFLAYYKNHTIKIDEDKKVKDLLLEIQALEPTFEFKKTATLLQINGIYVKGSLGIKKAVELFGSSWTIEPISTFRAVKDLIINDEDFIQKHEILGEFADEDDFKYYKSLILDYYSSDSLKYNQDYFGDSMFVYAHYLIEKYPAKKEQILKIIDDANGIWLYEKECNQYPPSDISQKIDALKSEFPVQPLKGYTDETTAYYGKAEDLLATHFKVEKDEDCALETILDNITLDRVKDEIKHSFDGFSVAFYAGSFDCDALVEVNKEAQNLLSALGANVVNFASSDDADGFDIAPYNENIAFKKAGNIALDAFDSGADILVVDNRESHFMMDQSVKKCEKATGRDIRIPILNISQMVALAIGITDKEKLGLDQHKIKPEFI
jgi:succinate dehydrogenase/fumarate reductase-like Fe-S protein